MNEEEITQRDSQPEPQTIVPAKPQGARPPTATAESNSSMASRNDGGWARASTSQVVRTVAIALLTTVLVLGALFLLWQVRTFVGWFVIALFLAAVLNPAVNWLQRRHRLIKRPLAIALTYLGALAALLFMVGIFLPLLVDQLRGLVNFVAAAQAPEGPTEYIRALFQQYGLGGLFERFSAQLSDLRNQLAELLRNALLSTGQIAIGAASFITALVTVLTLTFFLILGSERYVNAGVGLFAESHQPLVRRILEQSAGAISGYVSGNLAISVICGVTTFVVLLLLGMPYAAPLALLVAVLDLIPLVGATLGGALLVIVGLFVEPWKAVVPLIFVLVYQQLESNVLQPMVYSQAVQLNGLVILIALLVGGQLLGIPGALLAIPVAEIIRILITELLAYRRTTQEVSDLAAASSSPPTTSE
jgi:predicted PurR-regulated permease PerM